jgi:hypothetical protein
MHRQQYEGLLKSPLADGVEVYFYITNGKLLRFEKITVTADSLPPASPTPARGSSSAYD